MRSRSGRIGLAAVLTFLSLLAIGAVIGTSTTAWADGDQTRAKQFFETGNRNFDDGRYSDALAAYRHSFDLMARPNTVYNIAKCQDLLGKTEDAIQDYQRFLDLGGGDPALVERAKAQILVLRKMLQVVVTVTSQPVGAEVRVDGNESVVAHTPASLTLADGKHELRLSATLHKPATRTIEVSAGNHPPVDVTLEPRGAISITTDPPDAKIEIDGRPESAYGQLAGELDPGTYHVNVRRDGFHSQSVDVVVTAGATTPEKVTLVSVAPPPPATAPVELHQPPPSGNDRSELRVAGIIVGAVGVVCLATGVQQTFAAKSDSNQAQDSAAMKMFNAAAFNSATSEQSRSFLLYAAGGAALVTGTVLYLVGRGGSTSVEPVVGVGQVGMSFSTSF